MEQSHSESSDAGELVQDGELNLEALSERLGPFDPPGDFDHGDEFAPAAPRPVPRRLRTGSFGRRRWSTVLTLFTLGVGCVIFAPIPFVQKLSFHILPLKFLHFIGYGLITLAVIVALRNRLSKLRYVSVRDGEPLVGRVLGVFTPIRIVIDPNTKAVTQFFRYLAALEFEDPQTRKLERVSVLSEDEWDVKKQPRFDPGIDAGDYVTLVRMPGGGIESVRLYGFLGLDPERDFITRDGRPLSGISPFNAVLISLAVLTVIWFFILGMYVLQCCMPQEWSWPVSLPFLGVGAALGAIGLAWLIAREQRTQGTPKKSGVMFAGAGGAFLGALAGAVALGAINAAFDKTAPGYRPIRINQHWQTTHNFVIRTYEIEYTELAGGKSTKHGVSVDDLAKLADAQMAALEIREGAMGLEWIAAVHPMQWLMIENENPSPEELRDGIEVQAPAAAGADATAIKLVPRLVLDLEGNNVPCPAELTDAAINELRARGAKVARLQP